MSLLIRRSITALFLFSALLFLLIGIEGEKIRFMIADMEIFRPPNLGSTEGFWSVNPEMIELFQNAGRTIPSSFSDIARTFTSAGHVAATLFEATAENIRNLAVFITEQNANILMESALIQAAAFWKYSIKYEVPLDLIVAVAHTESHFNPEARSGAGAAGVMQVMWKVHSGLLQANGILSEEELHNPDLGIAAGSLLLSRYLRTHEDLQTALGRYFGGPASVYWKKVSRNLEKLRKANIVAPSDI
ncbi:MAG TPA: transglycosylase SLT domain-containing protein [Synergistales bacterium]|nr:transglycosylase SLT domain-containing protein [Synergistales bacterium]